jgi:hypothetical protein
MTGVGAHEPTSTVLSWPRQLDPAERYFWLLDRLACATVGAIAELDRVLTRGELETALATVQRWHPLLRARIEVVDGQPLLVEAAGPIPLSMCDGVSAGWTIDLAALLDQPFPEDGEPMVRLLSTPLGAERSAVALLVHHALVDGRGAAAALQQVLRTAECGASAERSAMVISPPPPLHDRFPPERRTARAVRDVLSEVRAERAGLPGPDGYPFHSRHVPTRRTRLHTIVVDPVDQLVSAARSAKATVHGLVAAAALQSAAALIADGRQLTLTVASPTDLRVAAEDASSDEVTMATGLLCTPYTMDADVPELARRISVQTHRELARGEGYLFYRLARPGSFAATESGLDQFASWLGAAVPNIGVSNVGIVESGSDPAWMRSLRLALSPSANQLAFVALTTYRDRLSILVTTDEDKLPRPVADAFVTGLARRVGGRPWPDSEAPSVEHAATGRRPLEAPARAALSPAQPLRRQ